MLGICLYDRYVDRLISVDQLINVFFVLLCVIGVLPQFAMETVPAVLGSEISVLLSPPEELLGMKRRRRRGLGGMITY